MQKNHWLRVSLATIILAGVGAGATLQGCSDDDTVTPLDAGKDTSVIPTDAPTTPPPVDAELPDTFVPPRPAVQKIIFVHAANYMGPAWETATGPQAATNGSIRLCLRSGNAGTDGGSNPFLPIPPLPNTPSAIGTLPDGTVINYTGLLRGTGGVLPASTNFSTSQLTGYALNAQILATKGLGNATCGDIFSKGFGADGGVGDGGTPLVAGVDFLEVGTIPAGTFKDETSYVITAQGCAPGLDNPTLAAAKCGTSYPASTGNLKLAVREVSRAAVAGTELGVQFINATPGTTGLPEVNPGVVTTADGGVTDAGAFKPFAAAATAYDAPITAQVKLAGVNLASDGVVIANPSLIPPYSFASTIAATAAKTPVALGTSHVFVLVGDIASTQDGTAPPNAKLHFLAFPANPAVPQLQQ